MPKEKYIITSSCFIDGQPTKKGTILELDMDNKRDAERIAILNRAGRIGLATKKNVDAIQNELRNEEASENRFNKLGAAAVPA